MPLETNSQPSVTSDRNALLAKLQSRRRGSFDGKLLLLVLAYVVGAILIFAVLWIVAGLLLPPEAPRLWGQLLAKAIFAIAAIAPAWLISRLEEQSFGAYGLPFRSGFGKRFWIGAAWGLLSLTMLLGILRLAGAISFAGIALHGVRIGKFGLFWGFFFLLVAFGEEFAFRGYLLFEFSQAVGFWPTALLSSLIFGYLHHPNPGENWLGALGAAAIGLFFCFTLRRTSNLWFAVGMHWAWDWGETFLYSVPDSGFVFPGHLLRTSLHGSSWLTGGSVGPEASALFFVLLGALSILLDRLYRESKHGVLNAGI
jgi:membrane protease YdiL (CAAX protease family)